ncbi:helix-turn-helix transcriptional regulator [Streptomyces sp. CNQ-509]|uniref:helix-turn-helix transcriptional regulator n=1 Tax=Streptomyces sp. CNQ-509 TaxID=444103 RepID=UPI000699C446|nr:helix-turn-helix transcriptional regulator [Streptomyces sp. CNQ-509]
MLDSVQSRTISPVFAGRHDELKTLDAALARAALGEPQVLLVGGEAGVGKSRLLDEFLEAAQGAGAVTAVGGCLELGADGLPFAPFATALRMLHRKVGAELTELAAGQEPVLARLLPDLGPVTEEPHGQDSRARLFELTVGLLERLAAGRTVVLALEDLHWADRSTRELLGYLVRSVQGARLVVLMTYRSDDVHRRHPLRPFLAELDRLRSVQRLELARLSEDEVRSQLAGIRGVAEPERELTAEVYARSEGIPFFVEELALSEDAGRLSDSLRDLLLVRVEALPEGAQRVVRLAARNTRVPHALLAVVSGLTEDELIEGLRAAVGANVLVPDEEGEAYRFRHALLREAVLDDLLPGERTRLSRRYAEALEADPGLVAAEERATRLASYWYYARDAAKALPAVLHAALETRARHAYAEQLKLLERALELWDEVSPEERRGLPSQGGLESYPPCGCGDRPEEIELHLVDLLAHAAFAARLDHQWEAALKFVKKALKVVDETQDPLRAAWFWLERSKLIALAGRGDGRAELTRAHELVHDLPASATHADVLAQVAMWELLHASDLDSMALAERAVELARQAGAGDVELGARITLCTLRSAKGDSDAWIAELYEIRDLARQRGAHRQMGRACINLCDALEKAGRSAEAVEAGLAGMKDMYGRGLYDAAAFAALNVVESLTSLGEWDRAEQMRQEWKRHAAGSRTGASVALRRAQLALLRGEFELVPELIAAARRYRGRNDGEPQYELPFAAVEMSALWTLGQAPEALDLLERHLALLPLSGQEAYVWQLLVAGARLAGDVAGVPGVPEARRAEIVARLADAAAVLPAEGPPWTPSSRLFAAELARARGLADPAVWAAAAAAYEPLGHPHTLAHIAYRRAEALLAGAAGGGAAARDIAAPLLAEAHATAVRLGAAPLRESVEHLAGRARVPLGRASRPPADPVESLGLTARETDVLRRVAVGRSNREIAEELFIAPKTASVHVSNLMAKLGVSNRGEAAAMAHRLRLFED